MSTFADPQRKVGKASRASSTITARPSAANSATAQPTRASSIAAMPSSAQFSRNVGTSCNCGTVGRGQTEVWDPFKFDCVTPGRRASGKDLLQAMNQQRYGGGGQSRADAAAACRPRSCAPPPSRNYCDSGESDSAVSDSGRRTTEFLYDMWCQQKLCDVVLRCCGNGSADDSILAHKVHSIAPSKHWSGLGSISVLP